jgi:hypothetical protein
VVQLLLVVPYFGFSLWVFLNFQGAGAIFAHLRQTQKGSALAVYQPQPPIPPEPTA